MKGDCCVSQPRSEVRYSAELLGRFTEQILDKVDFPTDTRRLVRDMAVLDGPDCLDGCDGRLGGS